MRVSKCLVVLVWSTVRLVKWWRRRRPALNRRTISAILCIRYMETGELPSSPAVARSVVLCATLTTGVWTRMVFCTTYTTGVDATISLSNRSAWCGFIKSEEKAKLQSVVKRRRKTAPYGFLPEWSPKTIDELLESSDITLFKAALKNPDHVIHPLLPPPKASGYNLRKRSHGLLLPTTQSNLLRIEFCISYVI